MGPAPRTPRVLPYSCTRGLLDPLALADPPVDLVHVAGSGQHEGQGVLPHTEVAVARRVADGHAQLLGGVQVDVVDPGGPDGHHAEVGAACHEVTGELGGGEDVYHGVGALAALDEGRVVGGGVAVDDKLVGEGAGVGLEAVHFYGADAVVNDYEFLHLLGRGHAGPPWRGGGLGHGDYGEGVSGCQRGGGGLGRTGKRECIWQGLP